MQDEAFVDHTDYRYFKMVIKKYIFIYLQHKNLYINKKF